MPKPETPPHHRPHAVAITYAQFLRMKMERDVFLQIRMPANVRAEVRDALAKISDMSDEEVLRAELE